jgi:DNA-binding transcriptional MocR family regulator
MKARSGSLAYFDDPRLRCTSLEARGCFLELFKTCNALKTPVLRFGDNIPDHRQLAAVIGVIEATLARPLEELAALGLVTIGKAGEITIPALCGEMNRREMNRVNGARGGRPRKVSTTDKEK